MSGAVPMGRRVVTIAGRGCTLLVRGVEALIG